MVIKVAENVFARCNESETFSSTCSGPISLTDSCLHEVILDNSVHSRNELSRWGEKPFLRRIRTAFNLRLTSICLSSWPYRSWNSLTATALQNLQDGLGRSGRRYSVKLSTLLMNLISWRVSAIQISNLSFWIYRYYRRYRTGGVPKGEFWRRLNVGPKLNFLQYASIDSHFQTLRLSIFSLNFRWGHHGKLAIK